MSFESTKILATVPFVLKYAHYLELTKRKLLVSRAFIAGAASQAGDADSSRAPGLTSGLQGSVNVYRGVILVVPQ